MNSHKFLTTTLRSMPHGEAVTRIMAAALHAVEPAAAIRRSVRRQDQHLWVDSHVYDLDTYDRIMVVGAGKAGLPMAQAVVDLLGDYVTAGVVIIKDGADTADACACISSIRVCPARHPLPDERGVAATRQIAGLLADTTARDLVIVLISGGGSALLTLPTSGVSLSDLAQLTEALLASGATIDEINSLRKHLDQVKGGGLARMAAPATVITLILSDVVGNPLDVIASGPTVPDSSTFVSAYGVLEDYDLLEQVPSAVVAHLRAGMHGEVSETPDVDDPIFQHVRHVLVGSNAQAAAAAMEAARQESLHALLLTTFAQGEARVVGRMLAAIARELVATGCPVARPACIILGGETTVTLRGDGQGGRNQELALAAVRDMAGLDNVALVTLATDGGDGPTDAAGAVVTGETFARAQALGLNPDASLANNDAYAFFAALDDLLRPGPTHTNVNDLAFVFAF